MAEDKTPPPRRHWNKRRDVIISRPLVAPGGLVLDGNTPAHILDRLTALYPKAIDLSLDRVYRLLGELGDPQNRLPPVVHVAGTNGKGSTVAYLRAVAEAAGYRAHVYTSPHLVRFNERIRLAGGSSRTISWPNCSARSSGSMPGARSPSSR